MTQQNSAVSSETRLLNGCITIQSKSLGLSLYTVRIHPVSRET